MTNVMNMAGNEKYTSIDLAKEPEAFYNISNKYVRMLGVLGGSSRVGQVVNSDIDLIEVTRRGLPKSVLFSLCEVLGISMEHMSNLLHVSHRTLQRKEDKELLSVYSTEQLFEIAALVSHGISVFGTLQKFKDWLHSTPLLFEGQKPLDFLDTTFGIQYVDSVIGRIEHGVYS
ncbi:type II RES/Xre toxin-antitoxin system antitoxin [Marinirhabdus gelatinilytica]|nr:antitoxin Xre-like helix-turn-helix domain-containing protein [Marinirhabdus gelatinilytica]